MDLYWEKLVENILGGGTTTTSTKTAATTLKEVKKSEVRSHSCRIQANQRYEAVKTPQSVKRR
jgi:hypothetical protein